MHSLNFLMCLIIVSHVRCTVGYSKDPFHNFCHVFAYVENVESCKAESAVFKCDMLSDDRLTAFAMKLLVLSSGNVKICGPHFSNVTALMTPV